MWDSRDHVLCGLKQIEHVWVCGPDPLNTLAEVGAKCLVGCAVALPGERVGGSPPTRQSINQPIIPEGCVFVLQCASSLSSSQLRTDYSFTERLLTPPVTPQQHYTPGRVLVIQLVLDSIQ